MDSVTLSSVLFLSSASDTRDFGTSVFGLPSFTGGTGAFDSVPVSDPAFLSAGFAEEVVNGSGAFSSSFVPVSEDVLAELFDLDSSFNGTAEGDFGASFESAVGVLRASISPMSD